MTADDFLNMCYVKYSDLKREFISSGKLGFRSESHDMVVLRACQGWRLMDGAEPSRWVSTGAVHMRYGPYNTTRE